MVRLLFVVASSVFIFALATPSTAAQGAASDSASDLKPAAADIGTMLISKTKIKSGARIFIAPMDGGFENFIAAGFQTKKVPLVIVIDRAKADYELSGISESEKAGWAKMFFMGSEESREEASIKVSELKTGTVVFAYSVHKANSFRGKQSAGEACAKHLKEVVE